MIVTAGGDMHDVEFRPLRGCLVVAPGRLPVWRDRCGEFFVDDFTSEVLSFVKRVSTTARQTRTDEMVPPALMNRHTGLSLA